MPLYSESDLVIPALSIIAANPSGISTSDLSTELRLRLDPSDDDLTILAGRADDKFSQKVRNLKSHETLEKKGLAHFAEGKYQITDAGRRLALEGGEILQALKIQGFSETDRQSALDKNYKDIVIEEGERTVANRSVLRRSSLLRQAAIKKYSDENGSIACEACGFRAENIYGPNALGLIEIHHTKPLYLIENKTQLAIDEALSYVAPLCPNCHRTVHRNPFECMTISDLRKSMLQK